MDIIVEGGDAQAAGSQMAAALKEVFGVDVKPSIASNKHAPSTRSLELLTMFLTIPPAALAAADLFSRSHVGERLARLFGRAERLRNETGSKILIDLGDGKPIPLEHRHRDVIVAAIQAIERRPKEA